MRISDLTGSGDTTMGPSQNRLMLLLLAVVGVIVGMGHHQLSARQMKMTRTTTTATVTATIKKRDKRIVPLKMVGRLVRKDLRRKKEKT